VGFGRAGADPDQDRSDVRLDGDTDTLSGIHVHASRRVLLWQVVLRIIPEQWDHDLGGSWRGSHTEKVIADQGLACMTLNVHRISRVAGSSAGPRQIRNVGVRDLVEIEDAGASRKSA
jgi:hypothetical protein